VAVARASRREQSPSVQLPSFSSLRVSTIRLALRAGGGDQASRGRRPRIRARVICTPLLLVWSLSTV
jgi:hypothetical protein